MKKGLIHIYTGDGKGKTTAAVGLSVRAKSRGLKVLFAQFMKQAQGGEAELLKKLSIRVLRFEKILSPHFHPDADRKALREEAKKALNSLKPMLKEFDLVVLDEFNCLVSEGLLTKKDVVEFLKERPHGSRGSRGSELVLTGRGAPEWLWKLADYVTETKAVKHPLDKGIKARNGIEY